MSENFKQGQLLKSIYACQGEGLEIYYMTGKNHCESISVVMESGQMAGVPWACITFDDGRPQRKVNLALFLEIEAAPPQKDKP